MTYKHTWTLSRDSLVLRTYAKVWKGDPDKADFCKLFWGTALLPLAPLVYLAIGVLWVFIAPIAFLADRSDERKRKRTPRVEDAPSKAAEFFARPGPRTTIKWVGRSIIAVSTLVLLALFGLGIYLLVTSPDLGLILAVLGLSVVVVALLGAGYWLFYRAWKRGALRRASGALSTVGDVLVTGFYAVKSNTCPRIEVR